MQDIFWIVFTMIFVAVCLAFIIIGLDAGESEPDKVDEGPKYIAVRHRAAGSPSVYFGPFDSLEDAIFYARENELDLGVIELNPPVTPIPLSYWS